VLSYCSGKLLADIIPRCTDPVHKVRQIAMTCIHTLLKIQAVYQMKEKENDVVLNAMQQLLVCLSVPVGF
jgi:hypothetical protein